MKESAIYARKYRETLLSDPYRPTYHFALPDGNGFPADPNGAFWYNGVYHLMYLYKSLETDGYHYGHISTRDLLHWRHHPDALTVSDGDKGCYSGGAFVAEDGTAYLSFWKFPSADEKVDKGGIALAYSKPPYDIWHRMETIAVESSGVWGVSDIEIDGDVLHVGCADPSNIWKNGEFYYMQAGNLVLLNAFGREESSDPRYKGDFTDLFRSRDLRKWEYVGRFYENTKMGIDGWPDETEDDMCPSFLPLYDAAENGSPTGKYLQLFISHNKGCQYYIGVLDGERFVPEQHGRMSFADISYFAPEALIDGTGRHIMWAWIRNDCASDFEKHGWCGVYGVPRCLWYEDGRLKMIPVRELDLLEFGRIEYSERDGECVKVHDGSVCRIKGVWRGDYMSGVRVLVSDDGREYTEIYYSPEKKRLVMDTSRSGTDGWCLRDEAPFELSDGEELSLDIFVDKSVVEVYANNRQAICRRVYPSLSQRECGIRLIGKTPIRLETCGMFPSNPY
ncbi:MAG: glycoside hydrolase family 32 protein [Clostridia bacterium]|nr:glycoside hydrolase family 32 protein [Clostridia bacterium]